MELREYETFQKIKQSKMVIVGDNLMPFLKDRTLLYGYTCDRKTFHVYLKNRVIYTVVYESGFNDGIQYAKTMERINVEANEDYIPNKRVYPELSDYKFCTLLRMNGVNIPFTTWVGIKEQQIKDCYGLKDFYGLTLEDYEKGGLSSNE